METLFLWTYIIVLTLLINHEIDSAYWNEWKLFNPQSKGGIDGFLWIHLPLWVISLWGLIEVYTHTKTGQIISLTLSIIGIGCFFIHRFFIKKGNKEFTTLVSQVHLWAILLVSLNLCAISIYFLFF